MKNEILVIDDNFDIRNLISNILKDKIIMSEKLQIMIKQLLKLTNNYQI